MVSSGRCSKPGQARRAPRSPEMLHQMLCALSAHQPQCCRCSWAGRGLKKHGELPWGESRCSRTSRGPQTQPSVGSRAKQQLLFQLKQANKQEKETQRAEHPHIPSHSTAAATTLVHVCPSPSHHSQAESPYLSTIVLPFCCSCSSGEHPQ